ncbi:MAG: hypothetical protein MZW92_81620 [Comamonadaceae bacterium]|nr:hypothetical protein [Comamonadaceae bacterium]
MTETEQYPGGRIRRIVDPSGREFASNATRRDFTVHRSWTRGGIYRFELSRDWQPLSIDYPDGTSVRAQYSPDGQPSQVIHRDGTEIRYEYGPDGRLTSLIDPKGHCTKLSDPGPGSSRVIDYANGDRHEYVDDPGARLLRFDVNGKAHALFQETGNDSFEVRYRDGGRERFLFSNGRIVEAVNQYSTVKLNYDDVGRLLSEDTDGRVVRYLRNEVGALVGIVTPDGETLSYARDRDQRLIGITDWVGGRTRSRCHPPGRRSICATLMV